MSNILNINENLLRPFNMFILRCYQEETNAPELTKLVYNDFPFPPTIKTLEVVDLGYYTIELDNLDELGIKSNSEVSVFGVRDTGQTVESKLFAYLNTNHDIITIRNYYPPFNSPELINGYFYLIYIKIKQ